MRRGEFALCASCSTCGVSTMYISLPSVPPRIASASAYRQSRRALNGNIPVRSEPIEYEDLLIKRNNIQRLASAKDSPDIQRQRLPQYPLTHRAPSSCPPFPTRQPYPAQPQPALQDAGQKHSALRDLPDHRPNLLLPRHPLRALPLRLPRPLDDAHRAGGARPADGRQPAGPARAVLRAAGEPPEVPAREPAADLADAAPGDRDGAAGLPAEAVQAERGQHAVRRRVARAVHVRHHGVRREHRQGPAHRHRRRVRRRGPARGRDAARQDARARRGRVHRPRGLAQGAGREQHHLGPGARGRADPAGRAVVCATQGGRGDGGDG
nr:hypothetical protein CFP56_04531 [Quercus suber]